VRQLGSYLLLNRKQKRFALVREDWVDFVSGVWAVFFKQSSALYVATHILIIAESI
jgi:hypothetical protein